MGTKLDAPLSILATAAEKERGEYSAVTLQKALEALHQDGLVLLKDVIDVAHIDALNTEMCNEVDRIAAKSDTVYNHDVKCTYPHLLLLTSRCGS